MDWRAGIKVLQGMAKRDNRKDLDIMSHAGDIDTECRGLYASADPSNTEDSFYEREY